MQDGSYDNRPRSFLVYAPSRTVVVYALSVDWLKIAGLCIRTRKARWNHLVSFFSWCKLAQWKTQLLSCSWLSLMLELKWHISFRCSWSQPYWVGLSDFGLILLTVFPSLCASSCGVPSRPPSPHPNLFFFPFKLVKGFACVGLAFSFSICTE